MQIGQDLGGEPRGLAVHGGGGLASPFAVADEKPLVHGARLDCLLRQRVHELGEHGVGGHGPGEEASVEPLRTGARLSA